MRTKKTKENKIKEKKSSYYEATGRRKESVARIRLYILDGKKEVIIGEIHAKKGEIIVNKRPVEKYFPGQVNKAFYLSPFELTENLGRFLVVAQIEGGGPSGQLGAFIHGVARALEKVDKTYRLPLKKAGFLTRDSRVKERRKAGYARKARAKKQSPKR